MSDTPISPGAGAAALTGNTATNTPGTVTQRTPTVGACALAGVAATLALAVGPYIATEVQGESATVTWPGIVNGQVGVQQPRLGYRAVSVAVAGVFGSGGSIKLEGSNDGTNWFALSPAALTGAGFFAALGAAERPKFVRPNCSAGDTTTSLTITAWFS